MKCVITVIGRDQVGIIAMVANKLAECNVNILDISQTIMQNMFTMIMLCDITDSVVSFAELAGDLETAGKERALTIKIQHQDIFNSMHKI